MPTEAFVPLTARRDASSPNAEFRALLARAPSASGPGPAPTTVPAAAAAASRCQPRVLLRRDEQNITGIQIQCSCGEVIELACIYSPQ